MDQVVGLTNCQQVVAILVIFGPRSVKCTQNQHIQKLVLFLQRVEVKLRLTFSLYLPIDNMVLFLTYCTMSLRHVMNLLIPSKTSWGLAFACI